MRADADRHISVTALPDGMARLRGSLAAPAAAAFDKRLSELATSVCAKDSAHHRSAPRRRAARPHRGSHPLRATAVNRIAPPRRGHRARTGGGAHRGQRDRQRGHPHRRAVISPAILAGYGVIDAELVRELADAAARRMVECPAVSAAEALRYQPSAALERWIRCRDLTCRFPGCDRPATICDVDHTVPFNHADPAAGGLTVPWNLACYCREHHRLKTFHGGPGGWRDVQLPDATIVWTSPTGRIYRTTPGGPELFPQMRPACVTPDTAQTQPVPREGHTHCPRPQQASRAAAHQRREPPRQPGPQTRDRAAQMAKPHPQDAHPVQGRHAPAPAPAAPGSTTRSNPKSSHPTGNHHHPHHRIPTTHHSDRLRSNAPAATANSRAGQ